MFLSQQHHPFALPLPRKALCPLFGGILGRQAYTVHRVGQRSNNMTIPNIETLRQYIVHTVLPGMGIADKNFVLAPVKQGKRNKVFYLTLDQGPSYVIKAFTSKNRLQNTVLGSRFLLRYGIVAPQIYFCDTSAKTFHRFGCFVLCEERIQGSPVLELGNDPETIKAVAAYVSRLHSMRSSRWGSFRSSRRFGFTSYMLRKARERVHSLEASGTLFPGISGNAIVWWFEKRRVAFSAFSDFSLCHGDVNPSNIIITPHRQVVLIDTEALKYLPFPLEYFRLQFFLCQDDEAAALFEERYFADAHPERKKIMVQYGVVFRAFALLEFAWYFNKKLKQRDILNGNAQYSAARYKQAAIGQLVSIITGSR